MITSVPIRTSTAEKSVVPCWRVSMRSDFDSGGEQIRAALFDHDARKPTRRRAGQRTAVARREGSLVARAGERLIAGLVHDGTRQVRAHLRERIEASGRVAHQNARVLIGWVAEQQRRAA